MDYVYFRIPFHRTETYVKANCGLKRIYLTGNGEGLERWVLLPIRPYIRDHHLPPHRAIYDPLDTAHRLTTRVLYGH